MFKNNRRILRDEYSQILIDLSNIIDSLSIFDNRGFIIQEGYDIINEILQMERNCKDISEQIEIIGKNNWKRLKNNWKRLREIENEDLKLINR